MGIFSKAPEPQGRHSAGKGLSTAQERKVIANNRKARKTTEEKVTLGLVKKFINGK